MIWIGGEIHAGAIAVGLVRGAPGLADAAVANFAGVARMAASAAVRGVAAGVRADRVAIGLPRWTLTDAGDAARRALAGRVAGAAVATVRLKVDARAAAGGETEIAGRHALAGRADLRHTADGVALTAMVGVVGGVDTGAGAVGFVGRALAAARDARLAAQTGVVAGAAVQIARVRVDASPAAVR
jgi:hypothetical protein